MPAATIAAGRRFHALVLRAADRLVERFAGGGCGASRKSAPRLA